MRVEEETALLCGGCGELMLWLRSEPMDEYDESYNEDEMMMTRRLETPLKGRRDHGLVRPMSEERMREQQRQAELARECAVDSQVRVHPDVDRLWIGVYDGLWLGVYQDDVDSPSALSFAHSAICNQTNSKNTRT